MNYDFDTIAQRKCFNSTKWNVKPGELPMWVADMDFQTAPEITEDLVQRAQHGIFGYTDIPDEWYEAYSAWWKKRHGFEIKKEWLIFCTGVIPAISSAVRKLTTPAERVLIQTPVYNIFFNCILNNGRQAVQCPLIYENGAYKMDFEALEKQLSDPQTSLMLLCNPQNPGGNIWDRETLRRIGDMCAQHGVTVLSDEIHCDITDPGFEYIPFASVSDVCRENSITCISPTKTFNIAGLQTAAVVVPNKFLRHKIWRALNTDEVAEPGCFAALAAVSAFTKGEKWLEELRAYISENRQHATEFLSKALPMIKPVASHDTYLMWLDCSALCQNGKVLSTFLREKTGLFLSYGEQYGAGGEGFVRMNIACPRALLDDGLRRLEKGVNEYLNNG